MTDSGGGAHREGMARRSTLPRVIDERAFPIRVLIRDRPSDFLRWSAEEIWLHENLGAGQFAMHGRDGYNGHTKAFYFCMIDAAQRFLDAHPHHELADGTSMAQHVVEARRWAAKPERERIAFGFGYPSK